MRIRNSISSFAVAVLLYSGPSGIAASMDDFCAILNKGRQDLTSLSKQMATENNPLKKDSFQQQYNTACKNFNAEVNNFVRQNSMENWHGKVQSMNVEHYNTGPGFVLFIRLDCADDKTPPLRFQFADVTNPGWGKFDPNFETPLTTWKSFLADIAVNNPISWSGNFFLRYPLDVAFAPGSPFIEGVITNLSKSDELHKSAAGDSLALPTTTKAFPGERFSQTRVRVLTADEVDRWSNNNVSYALVEMFARYGLSLPPQDKRVFASFSWYHENPSLIPDIIFQTSFSDTERQNMRLLKQAAISRRVPVD
jgi:hypothetical protein